MAPGYVSEHMWWARKGWHGNGHVAERGPRLTWRAPTGGIFGKVLSRGMYTPLSSCLPIYTLRCWYFLWTFHGEIFQSLSAVLAAPIQVSTCCCNSCITQVPKRGASCNTCARVPGQRGRFRSRTPTCCNLAPSHFRCSQSAARPTANTTSSRAKTFRACFCQSRARSSLCLWRRNNGGSPRALPPRRLLISLSQVHLPLSSHSGYGLVPRPIAQSHPLL